jgi:hypothetical protein
MVEQKKVRVVLINGYYRTGYIADIRDGYFTLKANRQSEISTNIILFDGISAIDTKFVIG